MRNSAMLFCMANFKPSWDHYRSFLMVLRTGSLSAAARELGLKQSTIGRQIETLEQDLGVALFTRSQKGLRATDAGVRLRPHLETLAAASEALIRDVQADDTEISGTIRLTTSDTVGFEILPKILIDLRSKFPMIKIEISISDEIQDLLSREADIAIRAGSLDQNAIIVKKAGELEMGLFASKEYMRGKKIPKSDEDLKDHCLIGFDKKTDRVRKASNFAPLLLRTDFSYACDSVALHSRFVDAGCGLGLCWVDRSRTDRIRILPDIHSAKFTLSVAMHEDLKKNRKYRAVFNEVANSLKLHLG